MSCDSDVGFLHSSCRVQYCLNNIDPFYFPDKSIIITEAKRPNVCFEIPLHYFAGQMEKIFPYIDSFLEHIRKYKNVRFSLQLLPKWCVAVLFLRGQTSFDLTSD